MAWSKTSQSEKGTSAMIVSQKTDSAMVRALVAAQNAYARSLNSSQFHYDASPDVEQPGAFDSPVETVAAVDAAAASDLPTLVALTNELTSKYAAHAADDLAHDIADTVNVTAVATPVATDLATAIVRLNALKADLNGHHSETGVHPNDDVTNVIAAADASDQGSGQTLANEMRTDLFAHIASQSAGVMIKLV